MAFSPGQFAWIKSGRTPFGMGQHPISISSQGIDEPGGTVSFTIKNLGDWSGEQVPAIKPGEKVWLDGPHGVFSMDREQGMGYVFVAGGIGVTPLYSMLQTMEEREDVRPVVFFYGANSFDDMTFLDELIELSKRIPNLKPVPVVTHPPEDWQGETGYISAEIMQKYLPKEYRRFKYLICGPKPLMDAMETALPELGVPPHNVLTERFDMI
jgi:predicted ferric reductase